MKKHKNFHNGNGHNNGTDSGCDSDCPENISELCKKFDENLSEQDVSSNEWPNRDLVSIPATILLDSSTYRIDTWEP